MSSSKSKFLKAFLRIVVLLGLLGFLIAEAHPKSRIRASGELAQATKEGSGNTKQDFIEVMAKRKKNKRRLVSKLEINYSSKRKVPNGPDPIHNRRAGKSHRPPGHA